MSGGGVLAELRRLRGGVERGAVAVALRGIEDAVSELIEADKEFDAARLSGNACRMADAANRRRAALARVQGAA